ncbi:helix-turn-helix domain-containing protein [Fusicatenibacter saccharivorans]|uniref:helix-turn-helix domain-containing protein n=1 Tax=Lachnospiraceae TaxID=186803 RepID=UPI003CFDD3EC
MNGELLRRLRKQRGFTIAEAAESVGISRQSLSNYERGVREPSLKILITMSDLYQISLDELAGKKSLGIGN